MAVWEVVPMTVKSGAEDDFEAAFRSAVPLLASTKGCLDVKLLRAVDKQSTFVILIQWKSVEYHVDVFTKSEAYDKLVSATGPFFAAPPEFFHAATVIDGFPGTSPARGSKGGLMNTSQVTATDLLSGEFLDGPLAGLHYRTPSHQGVTGADGRFNYRAGETVTFAIGKLTLGAAAGAAALTLANLTGDESLDITLAETVNRARFVQSLSPDIDLRHGVTIDKSVRDVIDVHASGISFAQEVEAFAQSDSVRAVFSRLRLRFRGAAEARNHLRRALAGIKVLRDEKIPTRDGHYLVADVFRPSKEGAYPVLLRLSVYGRAFEFGSIFNDADRQASEEREAAWFERSRDGIMAYFRDSETAVSANASDWVPRGYVIVRVDGRGVGQTPGTLDVFSKQ